ncbi:probable phosphomutase, MSMEG_4193 family [Streptomyces zhaozhouensis]|uniref:Probable phosphomutase, MSMEG_4193 family n=1 Tax=Streptomyces zhaozhouensis TaxID=1300267 RepID=A0A286DS85_9ACTN|nr:MSMEG_4193 family putative phosphomutase [Streptomyces zhaozhouensis]SOD61532.1 probable phosphomutase, MSMEG_4193 family [Streptomyces zhaozhouensis]
MPTLLLLRHGRTTANSSGLLAGRTPGVDLDAYGQEQAAALPGRLAGVPLAAIVHSPLLRCARTVAPLCEARPDVAVHSDERLIECDYGRWTNEPLKDLAETELMRTVRAQPSAVVFPEGEALRDVQHRVVAAVREWDARIAAEHGPEAVWLACTHGDNIKAVVADALGMHLDLFQRLLPHPASVTAIRYGEPPLLLRFGDTGDLGEFVPHTEAAARDAHESTRSPVGGGA